MKKRGAVISLAKFQIPKALRYKSSQNAKIKVQNDRAKIKKFYVLSCHFDLCPLVFAI